MILACHHITKSFAEVPVLRDVTFHLEKGEKAAIVGVNGAGKTTLLRIITGEMPADEGAVSMEHGVSFGYLAQDQNLNSTNTIYEEVLEVKKDLIDMEKKIAEDERRMGSVKGEALNELMSEYTSLLHRFELENGYAYKSEVSGVLKGLGFDESEFDQVISVLSGGQKTRVALAKLLLEKPDIIILDEPTNHLDLSSIRWLETYLSNYKGTVLIVSHDRYFLDRTVTKIIEIENGKATVFTGNYSAYAERKEAMRTQQRHAWLNNQAEIKRQEEVIAKLKQFNREKSIKRAESRERMLQKKEVVEKPFEVHADMQLKLTPCIKSGREVLQVEHIAKAFGEERLFSDISFRIRRSEHVALIGDNGTGKTTILKMLNGLLSPDAGAIRYGTNVYIGYYDQEHHVLHDEKTLFEEISDEYPSMTNTAVRGILAAFLFTGDDVFKRIGDLSGGEKGRVSLAKLMLSKANFLILDEPTNHLDMASKEILENALNAYEGTVLYVSHDRYFINRTASRILSLTHKTILNYPGNNSEEVPDRYIGNYDYYLQKSAEVGDTLLAQALQDTAAERAEDTACVKSRSASASKKAVTTSGKASGSADKDSTSGAKDWKQQKEEQARIRKQASQLKKCEEEIEQLETRSAQINEEMVLPENSTNPSRLAELSNEQNDLQTRLESLYEKWEELQS